jgi:predicted ArsR family transcriptional regulator
MATTSSPATLTLKQADVDLLIAVCKQFTDVDAKKLAEDLSCNVPAARMRWTRFKEKAFVEKKKKGADGEGDAGK